MSTLKSSKKTALLRLSILADKLGAGAGEGRLATGFLNAMLSSSTALERIERLFIIATQNEPIASLGPLPSNVTVVQRRFPSRLRRTALARVFAKCLPPAQVAHGLSCYVFPSQAKRLLVNFIDTSILNDQFHPVTYNRFHQAALSKVLPNCHVIICISDSVLSEVRQAWPYLAQRSTRIYPGVAPMSGELTLKRISTGQGDRPTILAVGTIEPRKNYARVLEAYEYLLSDQGDHAPNLVVVGRAGWMCEGTIKKLTELENSRKLVWFQNAKDAQLADCYRSASVFSYLSLYEGFGYPPFEAAYAEVPMVVSNLSSVGEIWMKHACCVNPTDVREIVAGWKWALNLGEEERRHVLERQKARAKQFSWEKCVNAYLDLYEQVAWGDPQS